jgi:translation initiation factor 2 subunit 2
MFSNLVKKKKKKSSKSKEGDEEAVADGEDALAGLKKKKKKSSKPKVGPFNVSSSMYAKLMQADTDDFDAALAKAAGAEGEADGEAAAEPAEPVEEGDMLKGTGIWQHDVTTPVSYTLLLNRFFTLLHSQHPDLASSGSKSYKIPPPQCLREGNKKVNVIHCFSI